MVWHYNPYCIPVAITAVLLLWLARVAWLRREVIGATAFMTMMLMLAAWSLLYTVELASASLEGKLLFVKLEYFFIEIFPITWLIFLLQYTGRQHWVTFKRLWWLGVLPIVIWIALWTDPFFHFFYLSAHLIRQQSAIMIVTRYGPAFWIHTLLQYGIAVVSTVFCLQGLLLPVALYRRQSATMLIGALIVECCNLITITKHSPFPNFDLTPISALGMGLVAFIGLTRFHLLDIMPVARGAILENMSDGVIILDAERRVVDLNPATLSIAEVQRDAVIGLEADTAFAHWPAFTALLAGGQPPVVEITRDLQGVLHTFDVRLTSLTNWHGHHTGHFMILRDVTQMKQAEDRLSYLAYYDGLTGLPNRALFLHRMTHELAQASRKQETVALLFCDLDRFKEVNDTQGHSVGDRLLQEVAQRLTACVRETDTVARLGGDEFVITLSNLLNPRQDTAIMARRILDTIAQSFVMDDKQFFISSSIGITVFPADGDTIETLMRHADIAMYRAKAQGRNTFCLYSAGMGEQLAHRHQLGGELRHALQAGELYLVYQPQVDSLTHTICGVEALLRWQHPTRGLVSPLEFIPVAEETGLIETIDQWVLHKACAQMRAWRDAGGGDVRMAVNISARQFERRHIVETVRDILADTGLPPAALELEITESTAMEDIAYAIETLGQLRDLGVHIAIDDFGTGHCSFGYVKRFPVSRLKIDRIFIRDILTDASNAAIVQALAVLSNSLGLSMMAECVETVPQLQRLQALGCHQFQGFLFSKPLLPPECEHLLTHDIDLWNLSVNGTPALPAGEGAEPYAATPC